MYLQHTIAPGTANGGVCVRALRFRSLLVRLALDSLLHTLLTFIECMLIQSIRCQKNRPCVCVCVCVDLCLSLSLSFSLKWRCVCTLALALAHPLLSHSLFPFFPLYPSLSLSLYVVLPHVSYPTFTCFSHPISICGHRTVKAPYPVRSAKLSTVSTS